MNKKIKEILLMLLGSMLIVAGVYFFKFPNNFSTGGVSGIAIIFGKLTKATPGALTLIINVALMLVGFIFVGKDFGIKTVFCCTLQSLMTYAMEFICPMSAPLTDQPFFELLIAIFLTAAGSAVLFDVDASSGGTDIIAMIIKKHSDMNISRALFAADCIIVGAAFFVFDIETGLFCVVGFLSKVFFVNTILESINLSKCCLIIVKPEYEDAIRSFVTETLNRSATVSEGFKGAYGEDQKTLMILVLNRHQTVMLKKYVKSLDPKAFIIVTNTSEVYGKGFREAV